ncbi:MAG: Na+/H+ antiporter subunit E [Bradymonadia bacterium]
MKRVLWALGLAVTWYLWSGINQPLIIGFGVFSVGFVLWMMKRMDDVAPDEPPYTLGLRPVAYLPYIIWEIVKANLDVTKAILSPKTISPRTFRTKASQKTGVGRVIYANSITLTPGTITLDMKGDELLIHALTKDTQAGVESGDMDKRVARLEGGA